MPSEKLQLEAGSAGQKHLAVRDPQVIRGPSLGPEALPSSFLPSQALSALPEDRGWNRAPRVEPRGVKKPKRQAEFALQWDTAVLAAQVPALPLGTGLQVQARQLLRSVGSLFPKGLCFFLCSQAGSK